MTVPYLPDDCIDCILKYLRNYRTTLFNCLFVSRFWCKTTVPLLYADPFDRTTNRNIILTLILCFDKAEILQLKNQLKFLSLHTSSVIIDDEYKPLFEYPKFLENFNYINVDSTLFRWLNLPYGGTQPDLSYDRYKKLFDSFIPTFHISVLRQCNNIKQLSIPLYSYKNCNIQTLTQNLTKLSSLTLHIGIESSNFTQEYLGTIVNICLNLKIFKIIHKPSPPLPHFTLLTVSTVDKKTICAIIQRQNNLEAIELSPYFQSFLNDTFLSLEFQKHSLYYVEFKNIIFGSHTSFKGFVNLCNLKYLHFGGCMGTISLDQLEILKCASFKLEGLYFVHNQWYSMSSIIISSMVKHFGASLKELVLIEFLSTPIIKNVSIHCLDLITLEIQLGPGIKLLAFSYFKNLRVRNLSVIDNWNDHSSALFKNLASNLPISVKEVFLCIDFSSDCLKLKEFLENSHDCLETINLSNLGNCRPSKLKLLEVILNYIKRSNSLKFLGMMGLEKELNDDESKLFEQIEGVKIVDFHNRSYRYSKHDDRFAI